MAKTPLLTNGLVLKGPADSLGNGSINSIDVGIVTDEKGNIVFKDKFVTDYLKKDYITLKELYSRAKGIFYKDGKIYFKDSTLQREYSLSEIVNTCANWKRNLAAGSLWWIGQTETDHRTCANLPKTEDLQENIFWGVDRFIDQSTGIGPCDNFNTLSFYEKTIDQETGEWKWFDIQNLEIVIPPIEDKYKLAVIMAKLSYVQRNGTEPIIFRLYDATSKTELSRISVSQNNSQYSSYPVPLSYFGPLTIPKTTESKLEPNVDNIVCDTESDCGCTTTDCTNGDSTCFIPNPNYIDTKYAANSHLIKIQFHISNYHPNHWDRYFGSDIDLQASSKSSINVAIFDASPGSRYTRKHGTVTFNKIKKATVKFDTPLLTDKYSICLTCDKNINVWYSEKTKEGFVINSEIDFQGFIDWTLINVN